MYLAHIIPGLIPSTKTKKVKLTTKINYNSNLGEMWQEERFNGSSG